MSRLALGLIALVAALVLASLATGPSQTATLAELSALILGGDGPLQLVMREIRLPRALLGLMIGASLGLAGAALQGYLRNPLAAAAFTLALPLSALAGAGAGVLLVLMLAGPRGASITLILAGIAISALAAALTSLVLNLSPNPYAASEIVFWMMGSLADRSMSHVWLALPLMLAGGAALLSLGRGLDALTLGEDAAAAMGIRLARLRLVLVLGTACAVGAATAVAGAIGFVGLVVPHLLRPAVGARPSRLLWASALGGAAMVLAADLAVRLILPERDLKLGVLTAIVGAPLFLHLIYKTRAEMT